MMATNNQELMRTCRRVGRLKLRDWQYLAIASVYLGAARIRFHQVTISKILARLQAPLPCQHKRRRAPLLDADLDRLSWAIAVAARYVPWRSDCMVQAIAADRWMRRHHLRPDFYLGVLKSDRQPFSAHVWLRYGHRTIAGGHHMPFVTLIEPNTFHRGSEADRETALK